MSEPDDETLRVTLRNETLVALEDAYPTALDRTEAIRMAVDEALHRRRAEEYE